MTAKYLIRFDDFCPTMNWKVWEQIEVILNKHNIKPIIAVVPDNCDPHLVVDSPREDFWQKVNAWQAAGWFIAMHGYQHLYSSQCAGLMRINKYSEFAGLPYEEQRIKLEKALAIFAEHGIRADAWIAPAHAFDGNTVRALLALNIKIISDGFYWHSVKRLGALWIPQQLWRFRQMYFGLWTVCLHHNDYTDEDLKQFELDIAKFAPAILSFDQVASDPSAKQLNFLDHIMDTSWYTMYILKTKIWSAADKIKQSFKKYYDKSPN